MDSPLEMPYETSLLPTVEFGSYDGKIAGLYDLEETLGSGHFAVVKLARHVFTGAKVAVKVVDKTKLDDVSRAHLFQEVRCMKLVQHPNVVRLYEVIDTQTKLYLVLEFGDGGDLYDYIMKHEGGLNENISCKYFRQILRAITYCHQLHVVHRDLKPENVVFFEKLGVVKLTDFGFSNKFSPGQKLETFCGSLAYSAPEILLGDSYDAPAVDIWSLGVILYMLVCGQPPFERANDSETLTMIMDCNYTVPPQVTQTCRKLIGSMLVRDPKKRANLQQIAADPWLIEHLDYDENYYMPLISRQELTEEDHTFILQKMINGNIASKEDIFQSLEKNQYNHITATYYLLAEIRLRKRREEQNIKKNSHHLLVNTATNNVVLCEKISDNKVKPIESSKEVVPIKLNVGSSTMYTSEPKKNKRIRKCSIVREEDEDETIPETLAESNEPNAIVIRRESVSDGRLNPSVQVQSNCISSVIAPVHARTKIISSMEPTFTQKINQIDSHSVGIMSNKNIKDNLSLTEDETLHSLSGFQDLEIGNFKTISGSGTKSVLTHRRTKVNKNRNPSCSNSEASDEDTKTRTKKKFISFVGDTPSTFRMHRRDSHDECSDSQEQTFSSSASHGQRSNFIASNNSIVSEKKDGSTQSNKVSKIIISCKCDM